VLARVITFSAEHDALSRLVTWVRADLPTAWEEIAGFRGLIVLDRSDDADHVIAVTIWADEESFDASEDIADIAVARIAASAGATITREQYRVIGTLRIPEPPQEEAGAPEPTAKRRRLLSRGS
jgi:hypothetical protein